MIQFKDTISKFFVINILNANTVVTIYTSNAFSFLEEISLSKQESIQLIFLSI